MGVCTPCNPKNLSGGLAGSARWAWTKRGFGNLAVGASCFKASSFGVLGFKVLGFRVSGALGFSVSREVGFRV